MKRTSNMIYKESQEARELYLYTMNEYLLYTSMYQPISKNLEKITKGIYNSDKAAEAFYHLTTEASKRYKKAFGYSFDVTARWTAAIDLVSDWEEARS